MDPEHSLVFVGIIVCLVVLAYTSAVDAALTAINRHRLNTLQEEDTARAKIINALLSDPYRFKATILLLNGIATITATALTLQLTRNLGSGWQIGGLALLLVLILALSEALPKALVIRDPASAAKKLAGPMVALTRALWPIVMVVGFITNPLIRLISGQDTQRLPLVTEEELRMMVNVGEEEGLIEPDEREMIEGIFSFGDTLVREVMIPRVDVVALDEATSLDEALDVIIANGHSRIPVYHESVDQVIGILYAKDLLSLLRSGSREAPITNVIRHAHFVPETMKVDALLRDLQSRKVHVAIVVDEYGGTAGLVTIEDLLEEIVGDIQDEYDVEEPDVQIIAEGELIIDARVLLDDINDLSGLRLSSDESDRIGGLVFERLGRVPQIGDEVSVAESATITVLSVEGLRPRRLRLRYRPASELEVSSTRGESHDERTA